MIAVSFRHCVSVKYACDPEGNNGTHSLTMADGIFTPAVSVTSAVVGIAVAKPSVTNDVIPISIVSAQGIRRLLSDTNLRRYLLAYSSSSNLERRAYRSCSHQVCSRRSVGRANLFQLPAYGLSPSRSLVDTTLRLTLAFYALLIHPAP